MVVKRIYTDISEKVFFGMIQRARLENACVGKDGRIDIEKLLSIIVETYSDGSYTIIKPKNAKIEAKKKSERV